MKKVVFKINKIKNTDRIIEIEKSLEKETNIKRASIDKKENTIEIDYKNLTVNQVEDKVIESGLTSLGIELTSVDNKKSKLVLILLGIILLIVLTISILSLLKINFIDKKIKAILLFIVTIVFLVYGNNILRDGIKSNLKGRSNLNTSLSIGIIICFIYSTYNLFMYLLDKCSCKNYTYLEIIIFLIYFKKIGEYLEDSNKDKIDKEILQLDHTNIRKVNIIEDNKKKEINLENVKINDRVVCIPGDKILLDGTVVKGNSHTAEALVNGRSIPVEKEVNTIVLSGSMNCEKEIEYTVDRVYKDSYVSNIKRLIIEEKNNKKKVYKSIDRICSYIVPITVIVGLISSILNYLITKNIKSSIVMFSTIILISSPFGLSLSSPLSFRKIIRSGFKKGILIKNITSLENIKNINTIVFDKTATLTNGYLSISRINNHSEMSDKELLELLGSIEKHSTHAIGRGITKYLREERIKAKYDFTCEDLFGYGVKAKDEKNLYYACNSKLLEKLAIINSYREEERKMKLDGNDVVYLVKNAKVIATFGLKDTIKKDTKKVITNLKEKGYDVIMLTGDDKQIASSVAKKLEIDIVEAEKSPSEKGNYIKELTSKGQKVMMIGDGVNDAIAISVADVGVGLKTPSNVQTAAADIILTNNNLYKVLELFNLSKMTIKLVKQNIFLSLISTIVLYILTITIKINQLIILIGLFVSAILVFINTLRVKNK